MIFFVPMPNPKVMMKTVLLQTLLKEPITEHACFLITQYVLYTHTLTQTVLHLQKTTQKIAKVKSQINGHINLYLHQ